MRAVKNSGGLSQGCSLYEGPPDALTPRRGYYVGSMTKECTLWETDDDTFLRKDDPTHGTLEHHLWATRREHTLPTLRKRGPCLPSTVVSRVLRAPRAPGPKSTPLGMKSIPCRGGQSGGAGLTVLVKFIFVSPTRRPRPGSQFLLELSIVYRLSSCNMLI